MKCVEPRRGRGGREGRAGERGQVDRERRRRRRGLFDLGRLDAANVNTEADLVSIRLSGHLTGWF